MRLVRIDVITSLYCLIAHPDGDEVLVVLVGERLMLAEEGTVAAGDARDPPVAVVGGAEAERRACAARQ